jgi:hypothetical protein
MTTLPSPAEYERMTDELRRAAVDVVREEMAVMHARMARIGDRAAAEGVEQTAAITEAKALLPEVIAIHRDNPGLQAGRRADLLADIYGTHRRVA